MSLRIGLVAGEASGDLLASLLMAAIKARVPGVEFFGIGGPKMATQGLDAWWPAETLAVNGFSDALKRYRELSGIRSQLRRRLQAQKIDLFIGIDAPDFNLGLELKLKKSGIPCVHYVSPSIWAWRGGRIHKIKRAVTHLLALFPFEPPLYQKAGVPVTYVGHPLADQLPLEPNRAAMRERLGLPALAPVIALLPGSRQGEMRQLGELFIRTAQQLLEVLPEARFLVPLATRETRLMFESLLYQTGATQLPIKLLFGHAHDAMTAADLVLVASGTATLEAALLKRPMVIAYRLPALSWFLMKRMAYQPYVGLPNILAGEALVPEFLQDAATPEALAQSLFALYQDKAQCAQLVERFTAMHRILRQDTASKAANAVLGCLPAHALAGRQPRPPGAA